MTGFGHSVQIGAEPVGSSAFLWTEVDSVTDDGVSGWGSRLARFRFTDGAVFSPASPEVRRMRLVPESDCTTCGIDPATERLVMRYRVDGQFRYGLYDLAQVRRNEFTPLADVAQPELSYRNAGQCSALQGGGEGPRWEGRQGPSSAVDRGRVEMDPGDNQARVRARNVAAGLAETVNACGVDVRPERVPADRGEAGTRLGVACSARSAEGIPAIYGGGGGQSFQGYTSYGGFLYLLEGSSYGSGGSQPPTGNTYLTCVDWASGAVVDRQLVTDDAGLPFREPEGMAIQLPDPSRPDRARLCFGFASGVAGARTATVCYKDTLV